MFGINDNKGTAQDSSNLPPLDPAVPAINSADNPVPAVPEPASSHVYAMDPSPQAQPAPKATFDPVSMAQPPMPTQAIQTEPAAAQNGDDLLKIKQEALQQLQPLVGQLEQTPEEKFKTTMMLLQASDNPVLVKDAYTAANQITDEKARAQALLDVINEINYFTHPGAA